MRGGVITTTRQRWWVFAALLSGCAPALPEAQVTGVSPEWGWTGEPTAVEVTGENLLPALSLGTSPGDELSIDAQFKVSLIQGSEEHELSGAELTDYQHLSATVPAGLTPGRYDLQVRTPSGDLLLAPDAYAVTSTRADHLGLEYEARLYDVNEPITFKVLLLDPSGATVAPGESLPIVVSFTSDLNAVGVQVSDDTGLEGVQPLVDSAGFSALLGPEGQGWFIFSSAVPDDIHVTVAPLDPSSSIDDETAYIPVIEGAPEQVRIELPDEAFTTTAGRAFPVDFTLLDQDGFPVTDRSATLYLRDVCGGAVEPYEVILVGGQATQNVTFQRASGQPGCEESQLLAYGTVSGASAKFSVQPGPLHSFDLRLPSLDGLEVVAGEPGLLLLIRAVDEWGNGLSSYSGDLHFTDSAEGLDSDVPGLGAVDCYGWIEGSQFCDLTLDKVGEAVTITAEDLGGIAGTSAPVQVLPGLPVLLSGHARVSDVEAGASFQLDVSARDAEDNLVPMDELSVSDFFLDDGHGSATCSSFMPNERGGSLDCKITYADSVKIGLAIPAWSLTGESLDLLRVTNADLHTLTLTMPASVVAGQSFTLTASGVDRYGNPYLEGDPKVDIADSTSSLSLSSITLSGGGYSGSSSLSVAAPSVLVTAQQGGAVVGFTTTVVEAASVDHFKVGLPSTYAWLGDSVPLTVTAQDRYNNTVEAYTGSASISSSQGLFITQTSSNFVQGVLSLDLLWDSAGLQDRVSVSGDGGLTGSSRTIDILNPSCSAGPTADLLLDGSDSLSACLISSSVSVTASSSSSSGASALRRLHLDDGQGGQITTTSTSSTLSYSSAGRYELVLVVADENACGSIDEAELLVNAKGEPIGEVSVGLAHTSRTAGSSASASDTTVTVTASDCAGDLASGGTLYARTDLGELLGLSSAADGLTVTLSASGVGSFTWSGQNLDFDGSARVIVGVPSGAAWGEATLSVTGDNTRPQIADVLPLGYSSGAVSELWVRFTEPVASGSYDNKVSLVGPDGAITVSTSLSADAQELTITPSSPLDTSSGVFTLQVSHDTVSAQQVRDDSGNKLDGQRDGGALAWTGSLGSVPVTGLSVSSCQSNGSVITPDGLNGSGDEADSAGVNAIASATPTWWVIEVLDQDGWPVRTQWTAGSSASQVLTWDGRGDDGVVVPAGVYSVEISAVDAWDNRADACTSEVQVLERYGVPE